MKKIKKIYYNSEADVPVECFNVGNNIKKYRVQRIDKYGQIHIIEEIALRN